MGRDREAPTGFHGFHHFRGRCSLEKRQGEAEAEKVPLRRAHLDAGNDQEPRRRGVVLQIPMRLARVVVGDRDPAEALGYGRRNQRLWRARGIF